MSSLVDQLVREGLTDACVSPGSRSTPAALALARHGGVRVHVILDERSSAFVALGVAKASRRAVAVVCTSGTAVANLLPAVVEASMSLAPLLLLTADRPPELRGVGANQTIDQVGVFGRYPRWAVDADVPEAGPDAARRWRELAIRAWRTAHGPPAGPVHLNLPFREPLVPTGAVVDLGRDAVEPSEPHPHATASIDAADVDAFAELARATERGVIMAGGAGGGRGGDPDGLAALAGATGWPILAEPHAGASLRRPPHALTAGQHMLADEAFVLANGPDLVLQLGAAPTTRAGQAVVVRAGRLVVVSPDARRSDPSRRPAVHIDSAPEAFAAAAAAALEANGPTGWTHTWHAADAAARSAVDRVLEAHDEPFEGRLARDLFASVPDGALLFAGSSMPIRDLDAYAVPRGGRGIRVIANRGASGIDGSVSTALGAAAALGGPAFALLGDLAVLHDAGGLLWSGSLGVDLVIVVPNNGGGGIFDLLPVASQPEHEALFVTPHSIDLGALSRAGGAGYTRVIRAAELVPAVETAARAGGVHLIDVAVDRALGVRIRAEVRSAVRSALARQGYA